MDKETTLTEIAHEIWATAQLLPGEGIEDGVRRIESILSKITDAIDEIEWIKKKGVFF